MNDRKLSRRLLKVGFVMALAAAVPSPPAVAQDYPTRTVTIFVGLAPGTGLDTAARTYGEKLSQNLGRPVVIDNRAGASGIVAVNAFKGQPPDGHALIVLTSAALGVVVSRLHRAGRARHRCGTCSAYIGLQDDVAIPARTMVREFPVSPHGAPYVLARAQ